MIDSEIQGENHGGTSDLLTALLGVVDIDDDNEPAPENIPTMATTSSVLSNEWGHMGICLHKQQSIANTPAKLVYPVDTIGDVDAIRGELDDIPFYIYGMKEPDYVMQLMATYGTLEIKSVEKKALHGWRTETSEDFSLPRGCL